MAPSKASKRASSAAAATHAPSPKKSRCKLDAALQDASPKKSCVDPVLEGILGTLRNAEGLNEHCREMLIVMASPSLSKAKCDRHEMQNLGVSMIEEALEAHKQKLIDAAKEAQKKLSDLEGSKSTLSQRVDAAKASLQERQSAKSAALTAHEEAQAAAKSAEAAQTEARVLQGQAEEIHAELEKERSSIEIAYKEHFLAPVEANEGPRHIFLQPFLEKLNLEESLIQAMPSSCVKTKEQRGGFDDLVISELGKAFATKLESVEKSISDGSSGIIERKATTTAAEQAVQDKTLAEKAAAADLEAATQAVSEAEVELSTASDEWTAFEPSVKEATDSFNFHDGKRQQYEDGTLKSFMNLRDREAPAAVETEAATAGA